MKQTMDYSQFKFKPGNRALSNKHVKHIKELIQKHGYLESCPIIVNENNEVIDGQHRLRACLELGTPVYYVVEKELDQDILTDLNTAQLKWSTKDFVKYYAMEKKQEHYVRLLYLLEETKLDVASLIEMATNKEAGGFQLSKIKKGCLELKPEELQQARVQWANLLLLRDALHIKITSRLARSICSLYRNPKFSWSVMLEKATKYRSKAYNCQTRDEYIEMLKGIYNYNTRDKFKI